MKHRTLNAVDTFSTPPSSTAHRLNDDNRRHVKLDEKLSAYYDPSSNLTDGSKKDINISIKLSVPAKMAIDDKTREIGRWFRENFTSLSPNKFFNDRRFVAITAGLIILVVGVSVMGITRHQKTDSKSPVSVQGVSTSPSFQVLVPRGYDDKAIRFDQERKVASYGYTIGGIETTISQQPLPENFKKDAQARIADMAKNFQATKEIKASGVTAFAGKSATGPQSVIFHKDDVLIFIYSPVELDNQTLASFIDSLK